MDYQLVENYAMAILVENCLMFHSIEWHSSLYSKLMLHIPGTKKKEEKCSKRKPFNDVRLNSMVLTIFV